MNPPLISIVCTILLAGIVAALVLLPGLRRYVIHRPRSASISGFITIKGVATALLSTLVLGGMAYPLSLKSSTQPPPAPNYKMLDGEICSSNEDCLNHCSPGPSLIMDKKPTKYCIARENNCALPKLSGAKSGTIVYLDGHLLECGQPRDGGTMRFTVSSNLK